MSSELDKRDKRASGDDELYTFGICVPLHEAWFRSFVTNEALQMYAKDPNGSVAICAGSVPSQRGPALSQPPWGTNSPGCRSAAGARRNSPVAGWASVYSSAADRC